MKKLALALSTIFILTLTACGSASGATSPASPGGPAASELPVTTQLLLGTLKLDETENAVTAEQAAELLPLWQTLQVLSDSDTAAQQEKDALAEQIQETMTAEQRQAITEMNLGRADMMTIMQEQGMTMGAGSRSSQNSNSQNGNASSNTVRNFGPGGDMPPPEGGLPGGGSGFGGQGQTLSADQIATAQAARQAAGGDILPTPLLNAVIEYLQNQAGS